MVSRQHQEALEKAFTGADEVWVGPIHRAERIPPEERLDRDALVAALQRAGIDARAEDDLDALAAMLRDTVTRGDLVLILSNGAFGGIYERIKNDL